MMVAQTCGLVMYLSYLIKGSFTGKSEKFKRRNKTTNCKNNHEVHEEHEVHEIN
jgi:hypothetical protein